MADAFFYTGHNAVVANTEPRMSVTVEQWPIDGTFRISRGEKKVAEVLVVTVDAGGVTGRGEGVPYRRYGETPRTGESALFSLKERVASGLDRRGLASILPPGAARAALDAALWDLEAKLSSTPVWQLAGLLHAPTPVTTAYTLSLDTAAEMAEKAARNAHRPLLKLKLTGEGDLDRVLAVHRAAPNADLIVDANESWSVHDYEQLAPALADLGVSVIEQPFAAGQDDVLRGLPRPTKVCADESCHIESDVVRLAGLYDMVNVKLDKSGGLTEGLRLASTARSLGLELMVGCMVGTSLAMAPAMLLAPLATYVDLDGPLLLAQDRPHGLTYQGSLVHPPDAALWGYET